MDGSQESHDLLELRSWGVSGLQNTDLLSGGPCFPPGFYPPPNVDLVCPPRLAYPPVTDPSLPPPGFCYPPGGSYPNLSLVSDFSQPVVPPGHQATVPGPAPSSFTGQGLPVFGVEPVSRDPTLVLDSLKTEVDGIWSHLRKQEQLIEHQNGVLSKLLSEIRSLKTVID